MRESVLRSPTLNMALCVDYYSSQIYHYSSSHICLMKDPKWHNTKHIIGIFLHCSSCLEEWKIGMSNAVGFSLQRNSPISNSFSYTVSQGGYGNILDLEVVKQSESSICQQLGTRDCKRRHTRLPNSHTAPRKTNQIKLY